MLYPNGITLTAEEAENLDTLLSYARHHLKPDARPHVVEYVAERLADLEKVLELADCRL